MFTDSYFDRGLDRSGTDTVKWDLSRTPAGEPALPMWVADMDFPSPPAVTEALIARAMRGTFGYTLVTDRLKDAFSGFWQRNHGLALQKEWMELLPCVVSGMKLALRAVTQPGDPVIIQTPLYGPFAASIKATGRRVVDCPLRKDESGRYAMDLAAIEQALQAGARTFMLCNPHNPVSRRWSREELEALIRLLQAYDAYLISDEIHSEFVLEGDFVSVLALTQRNVLMMTAPSKTFNLAGLQTAFCVCPDPAVRKRLAEEKEAVGMECGNIFGLTAAEAAYGQGDAWLEGLRHYLLGNRQTLAETLAREVPGARMSPMEATYLAWVDFSPLGIDGDTAYERALAAGVRFGPGRDFGENGRNFLRINIGCPRSSVLEAVHRLARGLNG